MGLMALLESGIDWSLEVFSINGTDSVIDSFLMDKWRHMSIVIDKCH